MHNESFDARKWVAQQRMKATVHFVIAGVVLVAWIIHMIPMLTWLVQNTNPGLTTFVAIIPSIIIVIKLYRAAKQIITG